MTERIADAELVRRIAERDRARDAETELCLRFAPRVRLYGLRHLRTEDAAADLCQNVLVAVLQAAREGRITEPERVDRFILGTCRNITQRTRQKDARIVTVDSAELDGAVSAPDVERIDMGALMQCLAALDIRSRSVILLSFQADRGAEEIAELIKTSAGNVRVVRHRALGSLRRCLDGGGSKS